jgi:hypothetical protein
MVTSQTDDEDVQVREIREPGKLCPSLEDQQIYRGFLIGIIDEVFGPKVPKFWSMCIERVIGNGF